MKKIIIYLWLKLKNPAQKYKAEYAVYSKSNIAKVKRNKHLKAKINFI